ncbi:MAG: hypothetical protein M3370_01695, partial [Actinomycetota bacterium]|nr:hypothetical protein [Actinomycetota bacterium]
VIIEPTGGQIVAGPLYGEEGMLIHDCDLRLGLHAKRLFDAVGHYSRDDVLDGLIAAGPDERGDSPLLEGLAST